MKKSNKLYDVVVFGPSYVALRGQQRGSTIQNMLSFEKSLGHSTPTLAIGLSRLGTKSALISSIGYDAMGQFIVDSLLDEAVDISHTEISTEQLTTMVIQANELADQTITHADAITQHHTAKLLDETFLLKSRALLLCSQWLHSPDFQTDVLPILNRIKEKQIKIILLLDDALALRPIDSNPSLMIKIFNLCDVVIGRECDYIQLANTDSAETALSSLQSKTAATLVVKQDQACYIPTLCHHRGFNTEFIRVNILATAMGFVSAWLEEKTLEQCCEQANATETLITLNTEPPSLEALSFFIGHQNQVVARSIQSAFFANLCYSSVQKRLKSPLFLVNLGDNKLWQKAAEPYGAKEDSITLAKQYVSEALLQTVETFPMTGIVFEDETGFNLQTLTAQLPWLARSLEKPGEIPLQFASDTELTSILSRWPTHQVAKISVTYHPDDRYSLRGQQEALIAQLHQVCRDTKHALMIDLIMPMNSLITAKTHAHIMQRFYELGIYPDYWQMSMPRDQRSWENIQHIIQDSAPFCQGVIINATFATFEQLPTLIEIAGKEKICQGIVVGRGLLQNSIEQWFAKKIDDQTLVHHLSDTLRQTANNWYEKSQSGSLIDHLMPRNWQIYS